MLITVIKTAIANAETETTNQAWVHLAFAFHLAMPMRLDAFGQVFHNLVIDGNCRLEHHTVYAMMLSVHIPIDEDDEPQLIFPSILQEESQEPRVEGGGFWVKT